jgi:hypothetical protein
LCKTGGPLTKRLWLDKAGHIIADGNECKMSNGTAERIAVNSITDFARYIEKLQPHEGLALGTLRPDLPDKVDVITKGRLAKINGVPRPDLIARTREFILYTPGRCTPALLDYDAKGAPPEIAQKVKENGLWTTLVTAIPALAGCARVERASTSAGLYRRDTGAKFPGSGGRHTYVFIKDGTDAVRFLGVMHERSWLAGLGWCIVSEGGQILERSIIDRSVGLPERIVFEGAPILEEPLRQDLKERFPISHPGTAGAEVIDSHVLFPSLTTVERARYRELVAKAKEPLKEEAEKARRKAMAARVKRMVDQGAAPERAQRMVALQYEGVLLPLMVLPFDDEELAGVTVQDVLKDPVRYAGETLSDPIEGPSYGTCKAMIMLREDGTPFIHSFAHGKTFYELHYDAEAVRKAIEAAADAGHDVIGTFIACMLNAHVDPVDRQLLLRRAAELSNTGVRAIGAALKAAEKQQQEKREEAARNQRLAERTDPRPQLPVPLPDEEFLPVMATINEVLGASEEPEPPMRDAGGYLVQVRNRRLPRMHELTALGVNDEEPEASRIPAPEQPLIDQLDAIRTAELIETHIEFVDEKDRSVHLPGNFVEHYVKRDDAALPIVHHVVVLPIMLPDGTLLTGRGLNRDYHIVFRVPEELMEWLPDFSQCGPIEVAEAMAFLTDEWLCDVATGYIGKGVVISAALSLIERTLLGERPVYGIVAGRRACGKTTLLMMLFMAVLGVRVAAAAWSSSEEERRKALTAYQLAGVPAVVWDNIPRGTQLSCPHIERSCTSALTSDRKLGVSEVVELSAANLNLFTGNNIGFKGDLSSRGLLTLIEVDRADPENRTFRHPDPIAWTLANRGSILQALYTLLLGNPGRTNKQAETRFKDWSRLCGSAVENGARQHLNYVSLCGRLDACPPVEFNFKDLFLSQEDEEEEGASLSEALNAMSEQWPHQKQFQAADVARLIEGGSSINRPDSTASKEEWESYNAAVAAENQRRELLREFLFPGVSHHRLALDVPVHAVGMRLRGHVGNVVRHGVRTLVLKSVRNTHTKEFSYYVRTS